MFLKRLFSGESFRGTRSYLRMQRQYEIIRTILFFGISLAIYAIGFLTTGDRKNLLTIVAVLGLLPASKSLVSAIMFCRYSSLPEEIADKISAHVGKLTCLYDLVFTGNEKNYAVGHLTVKGNTVCGYSLQKDFQEQDFYKHVGRLLKVDSFPDVNVKVFTDLQKYLDRLDQMQDLTCDEKNTAGIVNTLKSISL